MRTEVSAGGLVICKQNKKLYIALLRDEKGNWTFPKGLIEQRENPEAAAKREVNEEIGLVDITLVAPLDTVTYFFKWQGQLTHKTVHYFLFTSSAILPLTPQKEEGITQAEWIELSKAEEIIGYPKTNKPLLKKIKDYEMGKGI